MNTYSVQYDYCREYNVCDCHETEGNCTLATSKETSDQDLKKTCVLNSSKVHCGEVQTWRTYLRHQGSARSSASTPGVVFSVTSSASPKGSCLAIPKPSTHAASGCRCFVPSLPIETHFLQAKTSCQMEESQRATEDRTCSYILHHFIHRFFCRTIPH